MTALESMFFALTGAQGGDQPADRDQPDEIGAVT